MSGFEEDTSDFTRRKEEKRESVNESSKPSGDWRRRRLERLLTGTMRKKRRDTGERMERDHSADPG